MNEPHNRIVNKIMMAILALLFGIVIYMGFLAIFPLNILTIGNVRLDRTTVKAGETINYINDYCKTREAVATVNVALHNDVIVPMSPLISARSAGCRFNVARPIKIPDNTPAGTHHLEIDIIYQHNPLNTEIVHFRTPDFQVTR